MTTYGKNAGGPPLKYKTVKQLQKAIDEYFDYCDNRLVQGYDNKTNEQFAYVSPEPYTMSGLAYALNLSRKQLLVYKRRDKYGNAIKRARRKVETDVERRLMEGKATTGAIFNLKNNFDWKDKTEQEVKLNTGVVMLPSRNESNLETKSRKAGRSTKKD